MMTVSPRAFHLIGHQAADFRRKTKFSLDKNSRSPSHTSFPSRLSFIATFRSFTSNKRVAVQKRKSKEEKKNTQRNFKNRKKKFFIESKENHFHLEVESERFLHSLDGFSISLVDSHRRKYLSVALAEFTDRLIVVINCKKLINVKHEFDQDAKRKEEK